MSFQLTEEQLMIQSMVRDLARAEFAPKAMERDKTKEFPADNLKKLGELGLMGMMIPTEYGGSGADSVSYVLALSEVAYACASTAVVMSVHNSIVCESILRYGTKDQKKKYLTRLASGEIIGAFALTEPQAGSDASNIRAGIRWPHAASPAETAPASVQPVSVMPNRMSRRSAVRTPSISVSGIPVSASVTAICTASWSGLRPGTATVNG